MAKIKSEEYIETVEDISKYKVLPNMILVREISDNTTKKIGNVEIVFPTHVRWGKIAARNAVRFGEVVAVPDKFIRRRREGRYKSRWITEIEVKPGDVVWVSSTGLMNAERVMCDEVVYYVVDYQNLVVAKSDQVKPLNGYVLVEKIEEEVSKILSIRKISRKAVVRYVGSPVEYLDKLFEHAQVEVGDEILYSPVAIHQLEEDIWQAFGEKVLYIQSKDIIGTYGKNS